MARNTACTVFIGNLDEKVTEKVLYEILIQAGYLVDLHLPRDKGSNNHKGFAFAEYETEEIANYAVKLFSGLVRLCNKPVRFAMAGQDKPASSASPASSRQDSSRKPRAAGTSCRDYSEDSPIICRESTEKQAFDSAYRHHTDSAARGLSNGHFEYRRRVIGSMINGAARHSGVHGSIAYSSH